MFSDASMRDSLKNMSVILIYFENIIFLGFKRVYNGKKSLFP